MNDPNELDDDHPLWCVNVQIQELMQGFGATEDHESVLTFLRSTGLPEGTVTRMHKALVCAEVARDAVEELLLHEPTHRDVGLVEKAQWAAVRTYFSQP